ncbi:hypothetical protein L7F22_065364 [Adiantum nelumboides]|nr:hypothetical protein [Adiantum nelumboides]
MDASAHLHILSDSADVRPLHRMQALNAAPSLWAVCGAVSVSLLFLYLLWKHHPSYGSNPSCPSFPIVGCMPFVLLHKNHIYEWCCGLFDRSPSLTLRLNTGRVITVATADPQVVHHILKSHFHSYPKGPGFYSLFADLLGNGIFNCDGTLWRFQRKVASHVFTSNSLKDFVVAIANSEITGRLLPALGSAHHQDSNTYIDLQALLMLYTFDTICQLTFGSDPACLGSSKFMKNAHDYGNAASINVDASLRTSACVARVPDDLIQGFVQGFQVALRITADRFLIPGFVWKTKKFLKIGSEKKLVEAMEKVHKFASFVIEQGKTDMENGKDRKDLLARFIRLKKDPAESWPDDGENGDKWEGMAISDSLLKDILLSFILAGRESIASGVTFAMWLISEHPRVEREVLNEVTKILEQRGNSSDAGKNATFTYEEVRKMNYLQAVLSESMRLYPPVPANCKSAAEDDILPDGTPVLKGHEVTYNVFAMGRAARVWGEDRLDFLPERWLDESGMFVPASPFKYPVFQAGPRICLGKDFAFIQMKLVVASLVRHFEFAVQPGFNLRLSYGVNMMMLNGLPVTLKRKSPLF